MIKKVFIFIFFSSFSGTLIGLKYFPGDSILGRITVISLFISIIYFFFYYSVSLLRDFIKDIYESIKENFK